MINDGSPHPPLGVLAHFIDVYEIHLHSQPLLLFDTARLPAQLTHASPFLLRSFLAVTLLFSEHSFYGSAKCDAIEFYTHSARAAVVPLAAEGTASVEILQALCLLTLGDIAGNLAPSGNHYRSVGSKTLQSRQKGPSLDEHRHSVEACQIFRV